MLYWQPGGIGAGRNDRGEVFPRSQVSVMAEKLGSPWAFVGVGLLGIAIGTAIILSVTGVLPVQGRLQPGVTNWIVICAGIVFAAIGGVFALTGFS